jgi:hypothetical protein
MRSVLVLMLVVCWPGLALSEDEAAELPAIDPAAVAILREAIEPIMAAQAIDVEFRTLYDVVQEEGHKLQFGSRDRVGIRRPDRARFTTARDDGRTRDIRYDGSTLTAYDEGENVYGQFPVPDTLDAAFDYLELEIGMTLRLADLFYEDISHLSGVALAGAVVGVSRVGEWTCDHLVFRGESVDWQLWVERGDERRIRKFVTTYHDDPGEPQFAAVFDRWDLAAKLSDETFVFAPPEAAERIPVLARPVFSGGVR